MIKLDIKYRPQSFDEVVGQPGMLKILRKSLTNIEQMSQASIIYGPYGSGKTTVGRIVARSILCLQRKSNGDPCNTCSSCQMFLAGTHSGYTEVDGANLTKVEDFRQILEQTEYVPVGSQYRVYLIDECHMMSKSAQNLLLKPLEEGIENVYWIFCTTDYKKIVETIRSRCIDYAIKPLSTDDITKRMISICGLESIPYEEDAIRVLVEAKEGHFRDVLVFASKVLGIGGLTKSIIYEYLNITHHDDYYRVILDMKSDVSTLIQRIDSLLSKESPSDIYKGVTQAVMDMIRHRTGVSPVLIPSDKDILKADVYQTPELHKVLSVLTGQSTYRVDSMYLQTVCMQVYKALSKPEPIYVPVLVQTSVSSQTTPVKPVEVQTHPHKETRLTDLDDKARKKTVHSSQKISVPMKSTDSILSEQDFSMLMQKGLSR